MITCSAKKHPSGWGTCPKCREYQRGREDAEREIVALIRAYNTLWSEGVADAIEKGEHRG